VYLFKVFFTYLRILPSTMFVYLVTLIKRLLKLLLNQLVRNLLNLGFLIS